MASFSPTPKEQVQWWEAEMIRMALLEACGPTLEGCGVDIEPLKKMTPLPECMKVVKGEGE